MNLDQLIQMPDEYFKQFAQELSDKELLDLIKLRQNYNLSQLSDLEIAKRIYKTFTEIEKKYPEMIDISEDEEKPEDVLV